VPLLNTPAGYGALTKAFHWIVVGLFAFQLLSGLVMTRLDEQGVAIGLGANDWYNWHKTLGLVALAVAIGRILARRAGSLPDWAPALTAFERRLVHRLEQLLYLAMFVMPISGFVYVMAGGYGVQFAGAFALPNPIGRIGWLAEAGKLVHLGCAIALGLALAGHLGVVLRHTLLLRNGLLRRMLPSRR
jgi:cytochrome b561